jgi:hypothetical protein
VTFISGFLVGWLISSFTKSKRVHVIRDNHNNNEKKKVKQSPVNQTYSETTSEPEQKPEPVKSYTKYEEQTEKIIPQTTNKQFIESKKVESPKKKIQEESFQKSNASSSMQEKEKITPQADEDEWTVVKKGKNKPK